MVGAEPEILSFKTMGNVTYSIYDDSHHISCQIASHLIVLNIIVLNDIISCLIISHLGITLSCISYISYCFVSHHFTLYLYTLYCIMSCSIEFITADGQTDTSDQLKRRLFFLLMLLLKGFNPRTTRSYHHPN